MVSVRKRSEPEMAMTEKEALKQASFSFIYMYPRRLQAINAIPPVTSDIQ